MAARTFQTILAVVLLPTAVVAQTPTQLDYPGYGFRVDVPEGWVIAPNQHVELLRNMNQLAFERQIGSPILDLLFRSGANDYLNLPRIQVKADTTNRFRSVDALRAEFGAWEPRTSELDKLLTAISEFWHIRVSGEMSRSILDAEARVLYTHADIQMGKRTRITWQAHRFYGLGSIVFTYDDWAPTDEAAMLRTVRGLVAGVLLDPGLELPN